MQRLSLYSAVRSWTEVLNKVLRSPRLTFGVFVLLYISFCGGDRAETPSVPAGYGWNDTRNVIDYALDNYFDQTAINKNRSYAGAAEAALLALPFPLHLYSREFYERRTEVLEPDRIIPGRAFGISLNDPYVIFVPDYEKWEEIVEARSEEDRERRANMTPAQRQAEARRLAEREREIQDFTEECWEDVNFGEEDLEKVIQWIELNREKYDQRPDVAGQDPYSDTPFGMQYVYFAATNGFLQYIDPHSSVMDPEAWDQMRREAEDSTFEGIGALLRGGGQRDVVVETPLPGSPALRAGLRAGDVIRKVDAVDIQNLPLSEVVERIRGPKETIVTLEVERPSELTSLEIPIQRGLIEQKAVSAQLWNKDNLSEDLIGDRQIGHIKVTSFLYDKKSTSSLIVTEYEELKRQAGGELDGVILDLRSNPGGFLPEAVDVADLFLPPNRVVVQTRGAEGQYNVDKTRRDPVITEPLIVLMNSGSASASEIVASALMDHNAALVLGERSFGKASVQGINPRGSVLVKLTTARYYAPRGYTIQVYGVQPDIELSDEQDGTFPPRFREEDMWKHLPELTQREPDPVRDSWVDRLKSEVGTNAVAERYIEEHRADALKTDSMLVRAIPFFIALERYPEPD